MVFILCLFLGCFLISSHSPTVAMDLEDTIIDLDTFSVQKEQPLPEKEEPSIPPLVSKLLIHYVWAHQDQYKDVFWNLRQASTYQYRASLGVAYRYKQSLGDFLGLQMSLNGDFADIQKKFPLLWNLSPHNNKYPSRNDLANIMKVKLHGKRNDPHQYHNLAYYLDQRHPELIDEEAFKGYQRLLGIKKAKKRRDIFDCFKYLGSGIFFNATSIFSMIIAWSSFQDFTFKNKHLFMKDSSYDFYFKVPVQNIMWVNQTDSFYHNDTAYIKMNLFLDAHRGTQGIPPETVWLNMEENLFYTIITNPHTAIIAMVYLSYGLHCAKYIYNCVACKTNKAMQYDMDETIQKKFIGPKLPDTGINSLEDALIDFNYEATQNIPLSHQIHAMVDKVIKDKENLEQFRDNSLALETFCHWVAGYQWTPYCLAKRTYSLMKDQIAPKDWIEKKQRWQLYLSLWAYDIPACLSTSALYVLGGAALTQTIKTTDVAWGPVQKAATFNVPVSQPCPANVTIDWYQPGNYNDTAVVFRNDRSTNPVALQIPSVCYLSFLKDAVFKRAQSIKTVHPVLPNLAFSFSVMNLAIVVVSFIYAVSLRWI